MLRSSGYKHLAPLERNHFQVECIKRGVLNRCQSKSRFFAGRVYQSLQSNTPDKDNPDPQPKLRRRAAALYTSTPGLPFHLQPHA